MTHNDNITEKKPHGRKRKGYIYWDGDVKDYRGKFKKARYHNCWRGMIMVHGKSYRKRSSNRHDIEFWLELMVERFKDE